MALAEAMGGVAEAAALVAAAAAPVASAAAAMPVATAVEGSAGVEAAAAADLRGASQGQKWKPIPPVPWWLSRSVSSPKKSSCASNDVYRYSANSATFGVTRTLKPA